jgi:hypothetical protein
VHAEGLPIDDLGHLSGFGDGDSHFEAHPPLPGSGNQIHHNRPSRPLGFHTFAGIRLVLRYYGVILRTEIYDEP